VRKDREKYRDEKVKDVKRNQDNEHEYVYNDNIEPVQRSYLDVVKKNYNPAFCMA
jgi:hypothetical protein